ncbi:hypothetical protein NG895_21520 [Aeoliella sp. ICT_H6.2]|uniref:Uncharacterized protein n=1 Tax=Aeoliella straminimaris TaxID=2954799 RepID=A0A9X2FCF6_9BACT|nr:hypothetical protein [Aeoliella straminimaris]MCO6046487.1 hypothetical protein [Aeoliella straminimaris]
MKNRSATHSTSSSAVIASVVGGFALLMLLVGDCDRCNAQTTAALRQRALQQWGPPRDINRSKLARQGFRVLDGRHVTLVTDLPSAPAVDELPAVVDAAVPLLTERFGIAPERLRDWHVLAMLIVDRQKFAAAGLMPAEKHQDFPNGLSIGYELWVANQTSDYYRRHLLLHELVHSFMATQLGACGPGWYMEGMAELLGTHTWNSQTGKLVLGVMPEGRDEFEMWGRTKAIRDAADASRVLPIEAVMKIDNSRIMEVESYAWAWALAKFLDTHPRYRERFVSLQGETLDADFDEHFRELYAKDWADLQTEWRLFTSTLSYDHDIAGEAIEFPQRMADLKRVSTSARLSVAADRGWQCTGLVLEAGKTYEIKASGRFVVGAEPDGVPWIAEPGGITLEYNAGEPLGKLLGVIDPRPPADASTTRGVTSAFLEPVAVGTQGELTPTQPGILFLRLNDSPGSLHDNRGEASVGVRRLP